MQRIRLFMQRHALTLFRLDQLQIQRLIQDMCRTVFADRIRLPLAAIVLIRPLSQRFKLDRFRTAVSITALARLRFPLSFHLLTEISIYRFDEIISYIKK